jgi:Phage late-transcription coactivator
MPPSKEEIKSFSLLVEDRVIKDSCSRIEAIISHCHETGMEIELASSLLSQALKAKIKDEAQNLNMIKKSSRLPV